MQRVCCLTTEGPLTWFPHRCHFHRCCCPWPAQRAPSLRHHGPHLAPPHSAPVHAHSTDHILCGRDEVDNNYHVTSNLFTKPLWLILCVTAVMHVHVNTEIWSKDRLRDAWICSSIHSAMLEYFTFRDQCKGYAQVYYRAGP